VAVLRATLTFVKREVPLVRATDLAELEADDADFLMRQSPGSARRPMPSRHF
jgi:hypothetical protein